MAASPIQVDIFLKRLKSLGGSSIDVSNQAKTLQYMRLNGLEKDDVIALLQNLTRADYSRGPMANDWGGGDVWEFGLMVEGKLIYVKLSMTTVKGNHSAFCMSFHPPAQLMKFPYAGR